MRRALPLVAVLALAACGAGGGEPPALLEAEHALVELVDATLMRAVPEAEAPILIAGGRAACTDDDGRAGTAALYQRNIRLGSPAQAAELRDGAAAEWRLRGLDVAVDPPASGVEGLRATVAEGVVAITLDPERLLGRVAARTRCVA